MFLQDGAQVELVDVAMRVSTGPAPSPASAEDLAGSIPNALYVLDASAVSLSGAGCTAGTGCTEGLWSCSCQAGPWGLHASQAAT